MYTDTATLGSVLKKEFMQRQGFLLEEIRRYICFMPFLKPLFTDTTQGNIAIVFLLRKIVYTIFSTDYV